MADTKIKDLTLKTPVVLDEVPMNVAATATDGKITVGSVLDIINGKVNVDSAGASTLSAASTDLSDTANINLLDTAQTITGAKTYGSAGAVGKLKIAGTTSGSTILDATAVASGTLTLPAATDTLVGKATTDTLTNKTLTSPTLTTPVLGTPSSGTLTNCTGLPLSGLTTDPLARANHTGTQTLSTISDVTATATEVNYTDGVTSAIQTQLDAKGIGDMVLATVQTVTGAKTFGSAGAVGKLKVAGTTSGAVTIDTSAVAGTAVVTIPAVTDTLVGKDTTDTLTNKTLTSPTLTTPALGTPASGVLTNCTGLPLSGLTALPAFTDYIPCVMEVPNDTVAYPDVFTLGDASSKITGMWLPNSAASTIDFKVIVPEDLHGTPAAKIVIYMLPRTTVANSTVNLTLSRIYVNTAEDVDAALSAESAVDVEITSTADFLTIYEYDVTAEPTAGELFHGTLKRDPAAANDDFTEDLFIVGMVLKIERATA